MGEFRNTFTSLVRTLGGNRTVGRPTNRWEHNFKISLKYGGGRIWTGLIWLRFETSEGLLRKRR